MEKKHRCKLCFRKFDNGRALGGHMRSHMMKFYAEERESKQEEEEEEDDDFHSYSSTSSLLSSSSSSSSSDDEEEEEEFGEERKHELSVVLQDRESETESSKNKNKSIGRRSKRVRKLNRFSMDGFLKRSKLNREYSSMVETEPVSSISETTPEEHVAHCLIMLSKDKWEKDRNDDVEDGEKVGDDYSEDSGMAKVMKNKVRGKYKCEECNKLFRSYQALGGHRASHRKNKLGAAEGSKKATAAAAAVVVVEEKLHQCPFCERIFSSGQALGGHKRSHFINGGPNLGPIKQKSRIGETLNIDLNLPAPIDDDETSQIAVSAVSDAAL